MSNTPSGVSYLHVRGRELKRRASVLRHDFRQLPPRSPVAVICAHDIETEWKFIAAYDHVFVSDGLIRAYTERAMIGINEFGKYQIRTEPKQYDDYDFIQLTGRQDVLIFDVDSSKKHLDPKEREEVRAIVLNHVPSVA
jgi:hypothetical protein